MKSQVEQKLCDFYEKWMGQLEDLLQLLLLVSKGGGCCKELGYEDVVNKVTAHHKQFYTFKWAAAHDDVLSVYGPVWLSPLENVYLWFTGWKPSTVFRFVESLRNANRTIGGSLDSMTEDQVKKIEALRVKIKVEEERVEREMERLQVAMADKRMVEVAKLVNKSIINSEGVNPEAVKEVLAGLERVMKMADCARLKTLKGVLDVLTPLQSVDFLAANAIFQIQMRKWGKMREKCSVVNYQKYISEM